jgi:pimeloyl-ACP methyl ester carboxylesterase
MADPVVLVHGWGGSFAATWRTSGFADLLEDSGRSVVGVDLLGHGEAPKPHDPEAYADLTERILEAMPDEPVDAVGFSLGAMTLLRLAVENPGRIRRLVLAGIGRNVLEVDESETWKRIVEALRGEGDPEDVTVGLFVQYANQPGNDPEALACVMQRHRAPFTDDELSRVSCPTLVVIGDRDFAGPGDQLAGLLPDAKLVVLRNCDHFATTENFGFFDAALEFLGALPG